MRDMPVNVEGEAQKLRTSRLMLDEQQIHDFEEAVENITSLSNPEHISLLCSGFDDATEHYEVMFGLVHAVESYDEVASSDITTGYFLKAVPSLIPHASGWAKTLLLRILNHDESRKVLRVHLKNTDLHAQEAVTTVLRELAAEKPDTFQQKVDEVLA